MTEKRSVWSDWRNMPTKSRLQVLETLARDRLREINQLRANLHEARTGHIVSIEAPYRCLRYQCRFTPRPDLLDRDPQ